MARRQKSKPARPAAPSKPIKPEHEINLAAGVGGGHIEVRERKDGWVVLYPEEGWLPCDPGCKLKHNHHHTRAMVECESIRDYQEAMAWAKLLAGDREIKVFEIGVKSP